jgi:hypothetical protein
MLAGHGEYGDRCSSPRTSGAGWPFHFTHIDNLPSIVGAGGLVCDGATRHELPKIEVGDPAIKDSRRRRVVPVGPGGTVADYVPFYFAPRSPMMYRIACDRRDAVPGRYQGGDHALVYLAVKVGIVVDSGVAWAVTDGNAAATITRFSTDIDKIGQLIDWPLMAATMWNNTVDDQDRQRRRMAELLVHRELPLSLVHGLAVSSDQYARTARETLGDSSLADRIVVCPDWYYGHERR